MKIWHFFRDWILYTALPIFILFYFVITVGSVNGESMEPTLYNGERVIVYKLSQWFEVWGFSQNKLRVGDIIVIHPPKNSPYSEQKDWLGQRESMVKRLVGLPGQTIEYKEGKLYRNGFLVDEPYISDVRNNDTQEPITLKAGQYYVLGDNRRAGSSLDSREFGAITNGDIIGVLLWHF